MSDRRVDISSCVAYAGGLPRPSWDLLAAWVDEHVEPAAMYEAWTDAARQWLRLLAGGLGTAYAVHESPHFLLLGVAGKRSTSGATSE